MYATILFLSTLLTGLLAGRTICADAGRQEESAAARFPTVNLGLDSRAMAVEGTLVAFTALDSQGIHMAYVYDLVLDQLDVIGISAFQTILLDQGRVIWIATEGAGDLNGDGDTADEVLQVYDTATKTNENSGWAVGPATVPVRAGGGWIAAEVREEKQGGIDLTGDGDAIDGVVILLDPDLDQVGMPLAVAGGSPYLVEDGVVAIKAWEFSQGVDLNGDGDTSDFLMHVLDPVTATLENLGTASLSFGVSGGLLFFHGFNFVLQAYDPSSKTTTDLQLASPVLPVAAGGKFGLPVFEAPGMDLNGDGDTSDEVLHFWDPLTQLATNLGVSVDQGMTSSGNVVVANVDEFKEGGEDLNGDGDWDDDIVFAFDAVSGEVTNLGLSIAFFPPVGGPLAAFGVNEAQSSLDLNGDGLQSDQVYVVYDPVTQRFDNTRRNLSLNLIPASAGSRYAIPFEEDSVQGPDLNGDGDITGDRVVHLYADGEWISTSLACSSYSLGEDLLAIEVQESAQGMDLNGDGDSFDTLLHVVDLR